MIDDCRNEKIDVFYVKSVSRFGRDTIDALTAYNEIHSLGVRLVFQQEGIDSDNLDASMMIAMYSKLAEAENESRGDNIKMGIKFGAVFGSSKLYSKKCYGYDHNAEDNLIIKENEAAAVKLIYESYLNGYSIKGIQKLLLEKWINSPTGKILWCKQSIEMVLRNEKYTGDSKILDPRDDPGSRDCYIIENHHPAIINRDLFDAVQLERAARSNVVITDEGRKRKSSKFSSKSRVK